MAIVLLMVGLLLDLVWLKWVSKEGGSVVGVGVLSVGRVVLMGVYFMLSRGIRSSPMEMTERVSSHNG